MFNTLEVSFNSLVVLYFVLEAPVAVTSFFGVSCAVKLMHYTSPTLSTRLTKLPNSVAASVIFVSFIIGCLPPNPKLPDAVNSTSDIRPQLGVARKMSQINHDPNTKCKTCRPQMHSGKESASNLHVFKLADSVPVALVAPLSPNFDLSSRHPFPFLQGGKSWCAPNFRWRSVIGQDLRRRRARMCYISRVYRHCAFIHGQGASGNDGLLFMEVKHVLMHLDGY